MTGNSNDGDDDRRRRVARAMSQIDHERGSRRRIVAWAALLAACLATGLTAVPAVGQSSKTRISLSGRIGSLKLNASTRAEIIRRLGAPEYSSNGNIGHGVPPTPNYQLIGYDYTHQQSFTTCAVNYFINAHRHRLESFSTTSGAFVLPGGVHVGMPAAKAVQIEHDPDIGGCSQGIMVTSPQLSVYISIRGGRFAKDGHVIGGRVSGISIDYRRYGVGVNICL
jgi:hypothetical protein